MAKRKPLARTEFLQAIQSRVARISTGASATRGRGNVGASASARRLLVKLPLRDFGTRSALKFQQALDFHTRRLQRALPAKARHWGLARKLLNIFLRDSLYTSYLRDAYGLDRAEAHFEIPLDSITAAHLRAEAGRGVLPRWPGVRHITPAASDALSGQGIRSRRRAPYGARPSRRVLVGDEPRLNPCLYLAGA